MKQVVLIALACVAIVGVMGGDRNPQQALPGFSLFSKTEDKSTGAKAAQDQSQKQDAEVGTNQKTEDKSIYFGLPGYPQHGVLEPRHYPQPDAYPVPTGVMGPRNYPQPDAYPVPMGVVGPRNYPQPDAYPVPMGVVRPRNYPQPDAYPVPMGVVGPRHYPQQADAFPGFIGLRKTEERSTSAKLEQEQKQNQKAEINTSQKNEDNRIQSQG